ncbi:MAG: nuclear transport factor 2 family protein [Deltaproteobacteria bacterium]|jgi:hypothetical protein|nr:nuclear transport factor 2 family protein [Deltaproteobacteria bacterium]
MTEEDVVAKFWRGVDEHDWDLISSTITDDFERHGMYGTEADTCRGNANYMEFVSKVIGRMDHHDLKARKIFRSEDGRKAVAECIETIRPPGEEPLRMHFINILDLNEDGLITRLDIFWKTPPRALPEWITPQAILSGE